MEQLTLGQFINMLENVSKDHKDEEKTIRYDFGYFEPNGIHSYRGYYDQLALGYEIKEYGEETKVSDVLKYCKNAIGKSFVGWKGGEYTMDEDTPLWVSNSGQACGTAIVGVKDTYVIIIETANLDD